MKANQSQTIEYRPAEKADIPWLTDTYLVALRTPITGTRGYWDEAKERAQFLEQLRLADTRVILWNGTGAGLYVAWQESDHVFLGTLCLLPEFQRRGIGGRTLRTLAAQSALPVRFNVLKSNVVARRFYERLGCRYESSTERHDHFVFAPRPVRHP